MRKGMYLASKKENAKRNALLKKAVQFCLASGMIAMPWMAQAQNFGVGGYEQLLSNEQLKHTHTSSTSNASGEYSKWAIDSVSSSITEDNCVLFHGLKFKVVQVDDATAGLNAKLTLWSYDTKPVGKCEYLAEDSEIPKLTENNKYGTKRDVNRVYSSSVAYGLLDLYGISLFKGDSLIQSVPLTEETIKVKTSGVGATRYEDDLTLYYYTRDQKANTVMTAKVWSPSVGNIQEWGLYNKDAAANGTSTWLRTPILTHVYGDYIGEATAIGVDAIVGGALSILSIFFPWLTPIAIAYDVTSAVASIPGALLSDPDYEEYNITGRAYYVDSAGNTKAADFGDDVMGLRPAIQILNQGSQYVFTVNGELNTDGAFAANSDTGTAVNYYETLKNSVLTANSKKITLDGSKIKVDAEINDASVNLGGLLTSAPTDIDTWEKLNGSSANIAYLGTSSDKILDLKEIEKGQQYSLKVFGSKGTEVTELKKTEFKNLSLGTDDKVHLQIGSVNQGASVTLANGAVVDLNANCQNGDGYYVIVNAGDSGRLNLGTYKYTDKVINHGELVLDGDNSTAGGFAPYQLTGRGTLVIDGSNVLFGYNGVTIAGTVIINSGKVLRNSSIVSGDVINNGTYYAIADYMGKAVTNNGELVLSGGTISPIKKITGTKGTIKIGKEGVVAESGSKITGQTITVDNGQSFTVKDGNCLDNTDSVVLKDGTLNIASEHGGNVITLGTFSSTDKGKLIFTADLGSVANNVVSSDYLNVDGIDTGTQLQVDGINLLNENQIKAGDKITVVKAPADQLDNLTLAGTIYVSINVGWQNYDFQFVQDTVDKGALVAQQTSEITLPQVVQNIAGQGIATYAFTADYTTPGDLGTLTRVDAGTPRELTINGNNHSLLGDHKAGITVNAGDTLNLVDIETMRGFSSGAEVITTAGTVNVDNSRVSGNVTVQNTGVLNAAAGSIDIGVIKNDGTVNLSTGELSVNISGEGTLNIEGIVNAGKNKVTQGKLVVPEDSSFSIYTKNNTGLNDTGLNITNTIENEGVVTINSFGMGGVYDSLLTLGATVTGSGTLVINGAKVKLNANVENKISVNNFSGELTIAAGNIGDSVAMSNYAKVVLLDGTLADGHTISGKGSLWIDGHVTAGVQDLSVEEGISINADKKLTLTGSGILTTGVGGTGTLEVAGNLIALNKISNNIEINENNNLVIGLKTLTRGKKVTGAGSLIIGTDGVNINLPDIAVAGGIYNDYVTTMTGNDFLASDLLGDGDLKISGTVDGGTHKIDQNNLTIYRDASLKIGADKLAIENPIQNRGNLELTGGTLGVSVEDEEKVGKITINGEVTFGCNRVENEIIVKSGSSLSAVADSVFNTVNNQGTYNVYAGTINSVVTSTARGILNIKEAVTLNENIYSQDITVDAAAKLTATEHLDTTDNVALNGILNIASEDCSTDLTFGTLSGNGQLILQADISGEGDAKSDCLTVTTINDGTILNVDGLNLTASDDDTTERVVVVKSAADQLAHLTMNGPSMVLSNGCKYTFTQDTSANDKRGTLVGTWDQSIDNYTLPKVIQNLTTGTLGTVTIDTFSFVDNYTAPENLGTLARAAVTTPPARTLTIEGNGYNLDGGGHAGVTVYKDDTLNFNNVKEIKNFNGDVITAAGNVAVSNGKVVGDVSVTGNGIIVLNGTELQGNLTTKDNGIVLTVNGGKITGALTLQEKAVVITETGNIEGSVSNAGALLLYDGGELKKDVQGEGYLIVSGGTFAFSGDVIENKVYIDEGTVFDPKADSFKASVVNSGTLELDGGTLCGTESKSVNITNRSGSTLVINKPVTIGGYSEIVVSAGTTLQIAADKFTAEQTAAVRAGNAALNGIDNMNKLNINDTATIKMTGNTTNGGYYVLLGGSAIKDITNYSKFKNILLEDSRITRTRWFETDDALALQVNFTTEAELNVLGLAGVQQGVISVNNQTADAVVDHLSLTAKGHQDKAYDKEVWATYIHNKDDVDGLDSGSYSSDYRGQYNGVTVGVDLATTKKAITGIALSYASGKTNGIGADAQIRNESKHYGLSLYNRVTNNHSAVIMDLGLMHSKNEINTIQDNGSEADAKVNSFTIGARIERDIQLKGSKLVPFAGVHYLHLQNKDFTNDKNLRYTTDNQNLIVPKLGLAWSGEYKMSQNQWTVKPKVEIGYLWNLGNRNADVITNVNGYLLDTNFDVTDKSSYYAKLGLDFFCRNFMVGLGYSYVKGDAVRGDRWNVNLAWNF